MASLRVHKVVSALPSTLEADALYLVRAGSGFDLYVTNHSGAIVAYSLNQTASWDLLKSVAPVSGVATLDLSRPAGFRVSLTGDTALAFSNVPTGRVVVFTVTFVQDATGGRLVSYGSNVKAEGGAAPAQPATAPGSVTVQSFYTDDGGATIWQAGGSAWSTFGFGQDYVDQTANRALSTIYTNTTGKPILVFVWATATSQYANLTAIVNGKLVGQGYQAFIANAMSALTFVVPVGATYEVRPVATAPINKWWELR